MWLRVPETIHNVLWEGPLEPTTEDAIERLGTEWAVRGIKANVRDIVRDMPVVSIGQPEVWSLTDVYPRDKMPAFLQTKLDEADFYLVRLSCSFRPVRVESRVQWARFLVHLLPDHTGGQPIAFDLHPLRVTKEVKRNVKVTLSPALKFQEIEAKVGEIEFGFEYPELQPIISAAGAGEPKPSWDYEEAKGLVVQGSKFMHVLIKVRRGRPVVRALLDLVADVEVQKTRLPVLVIRDKDEARGHLTVRLV